jgi:nucleoside-diphosphate-sugar epimerase
MRIVVIGATGHVGTYLVPRLFHAGHALICITRGQQDAYVPDRAWDRVERLCIDREAEDRRGEFAPRVAAMQPDIVIDNICYTPDSARQMVEALRGRVQHYLLTGTIWVHGPSVVVPTTEEQPRRPFGSYGIQKAEIEAYLLDEARRHGFPATILHLGHVVGRGWVPLNPAGNFNPVVYERLAAGEEVAIPNLGMETIHHVHSDDVAQAFMLAMARRSVALGESFHVVSPAAVTLRGFAEAVAGWFGREPRLKFLAWEDWRKTVSEADAAATWDHIAHSPSISIAKARDLLGYVPRYSSLDAVRESLDYLMEHGKLARA